MIDRAVFGVAALALLVLGLRPSSERMVDPTSVVVRVPGATLAEARAVADSVGAGTTIDLVAGMPMGSARQLHIVGWGLDAGELRQAGTRTLVLHPRSLPDGVRTISWDPSVRLGEVLEVRASVRSSRRSVLVLLSEAGPVDSMAIAAGQLTEVVLRHAPRAAGSAQYALRLGAKTDTFSVPVTVSPPPSLIILASAPAREWSDLRDWIARQGGSVTFRTTVSRDRSRLDRVNLPDNGPWTFDRSTLERTSLVVTDGRTLARLSPVERAALRMAVRAGLGLVVVLDRDARDPRAVPAVDRAALLPWTTAAVGDLEERQLRPRVRGAPISPTPIAAEPVVIGRNVFGSTPLLDDGQDGALAMVATEGAGRIVGTVVTGAGRWLRGGEPEAFGSYWNTLVRAAARPDPTETRWEVGNGPLLVDAEVTPVHWGLSRVSVTLDGEPVGMAVDPLVPGRAVAHWWPRHPGWNDIESTKVWIGGRESWSAWQAAERRRVTELWIDQHRSVMNDRERVPVRSPWPLWPFYLVFVGATAWLWRIPR